MEAELKKYPQTIKHLKSLIRWDLILLHRNKLFIIAFLVALIYIGIFYLLQFLGNLQLILVILIFNDPVVTCFIFSAVIWLFDKNQATLKAVSVLPVPISLYLLSKILILSLLATIMAIIMAFATRGTDFNIILLSLSVFLSGFMFSCLGFISGAFSENFNQFLIYSVPFLVLAGVPFLRLFEVGEVFHFIIIPSTGGIELLNSAFEEKLWWYNLLMLLHLLVGNYLVWKLCISIVSKKMI